jgi:hypothetical protein
MAELRALTTPSSAGTPVVAFEELRERAKKAGNAVVAALCLRFVAEKTFDLARRARVERQLVREHPVSWTYAALAMTERDRGRIRTARRLYAEALSRLEPAKEDRRASLEEALHEIDLALAGDRSMINRRIAFRRTVLAEARITPRSAAKEFAKLDQHAREAKRAKDHGSEQVYLRGLADLASILGDGSRAARYLGRLGNAQNTPEAHERAADAFLEAGDVERAVQFARKAYERARLTRSPRAPDLERKYIALKSRTRRSPRR